MIKFAVIAPLLLSVGCTFIARDPDSYREVTRELVETRGADLEDCYDVALRTDESVGGTVVVNFTVEKKTGKIMNPVVDEAQSNAPAELSSCVITAIDGLQLDPPDAREGQATFRWKFEAKPAAPAA
ncbi:AgmX/PglI C-terminal domain-containing protein [Enhygromyxa salina]|nr:AgmX/PglI C-terminal domain-containing protein [Enhygromyxa salina]